MQSENGLVDMDFAQSEESDYGFISLDWFIGGGLIQDASYEVMIEAKCDKIAGPIEFQYSRDNIITGVIDFNPPEPYGYPQPLKDEILLGQEIYVEFTEDLDCGTPFSFDLEMTIAGPTTSPSLSLIPSSSPRRIPSTSASPSDLPSSVPSTAPSDIPSLVPSLLPSDIPSSAPSSMLSSVPSDVPSLSPSDAPSDLPSSIPSLIPSTIPSDLPSDVPSKISVPNGGSSRTRNLNNVGSSRRRLSQNSDFVLRNGDGLHVICEGRKIQFQVDYTSGLSVSQINGQEFTVEIGRIGGESVSYIEDKNQNPIDHQTKDISCSVDGERQLRSEVSQFSSLQIDDRINISDVFCDEKTSVLSAEVEIMSLPNSRRLLKGSDRSTSSNIFESLKDALNNDESVGTEQRLLREGVSYSIQDVRIIPCKEDLEIYSIDLNSDADYSEDIVEDADIAIRNGGNRELKQIENEDKLLLEMKQMENMREIKLKEHEQTLLDKMEKKRELEIKEIKEMEKKKELEMKELEKKRELEMEKHEQMLLDEMQRMKESEVSMMKYQMAMLFGGCLFASFAAIQMMRRQNN